MKIPKKRQAIAITVVIVYDTRNKFSTLCWQVLPVYGDLQKQMLSLQTPRPSRQGGLHSSVGLSGSGGQFVGIAWFKLPLVLAAWKCCRSRSLLVFTATKACGFVRGDDCSVEGS
jgi:hypothetical protein